MEPLTLDPKKTALVVIDLQQGILAVDAEPRPTGVVVANTLRLAGAFRRRKGFVVLVRVDFAPDGADALHPGADSARPIPGDRPDDWASFAPGLAGAGDHFVTKKQWGAFYGTDLDLQLRRRGIGQIVLCGIATCFGVESTARQAYELGYEQVFVEDAMASRSAAEHEHTVSRIFPRIGRVRTVEDVVGALR